VPASVAVLVRIFGHSNLSAPNRDHRDDNYENYNCYQDCGGNCQSTHQVWCHLITPRKIKTQ
jgi:hypothetical protein